MRSTLAILAAFLLPAILIADDERERMSRTAFAFTINTPKVYKDSPAPAPTPSTYNGSSDALDEVNAYRAKRGLPPFQRDELLTQAAQKAASIRASKLIAGHLNSDFDCLPPGAQADAAGCGALEDSWGWGTCCSDENYAHAGAAWVRGSDGKRYMHLFVRSAGSTPVNGGSRVTGGARSSTSTGDGTCTTGSCSQEGMQTEQRQNYSPRQTGRIKLFNTRRGGSCSNGSCG